MAGRRAGKASRTGTAVREGAPRSRRKAPAAGTKITTPDATFEERIAALEQERDALRAALEQERARRRALEEVYAAARGRISKALDSLQTILNAQS